jgi:XTP/dITP diphosphohydrolase
MRSLPPATEFVGSNGSGRKNTQSSDMILYTMRLLLATTNRGKVQEIRELLADSGNTILGLDEVDAIPEMEETGATFGENALIKARYYHSLTGLVTIADDSGLEVEALAGMPGIRSARYAGTGASDQDRIEKLLNELKGQADKDRRARFVCAAAIVWKHGQRLFVEQVCGTILAAPRGFNGFGYDPVFYFPLLNKTFAELSRDEKGRISHRGKAFARLARWLKESFLDSPGSC